VSDFIERCRAEVIKTARAMGYQGERLMTRLNDLGFSPAEAATMMQAEEKAAHGAQIRAAATAAARAAVTEAVGKLRAEKRTSAAKREAPLKLEDYPSWERWRDAVRKRAASGAKVALKSEEPEETEKAPPPPPAEPVPSRQVLVEESGDGDDGDSWVAESSGSIWSNIVYGG